MLLHMPYIYICDHNPCVETGLFGCFGVVAMPQQGYEALFASRVLPEPYESLEQRRFGWTMRDLRDEVLDRQRRFIGSLHDLGPQRMAYDPHLRTVGLRYIGSCGDGPLGVVLVGKAFAPELDQARMLATEWYREIAALFPAEYKLLPITSEEAFMEQSGQALLDAVSNSHQIVEIRRYEALPAYSPTQDMQRDIYVVHPFAWHPEGMDQLWRVIASEPHEIVFSVALRPSYLYEDEKLALVQEHATARALEESETAIGHLLGKQAVRIHAEYFRSWQQPFLVRIHIASSSDVSRAVVRAAGCALSYGGPVDGQQCSLPFPGYELAVPTDDECEIARDNARLLEMAHWGLDCATGALRRFRYLMGTAEAHCAFRLPVMYKKGVPGVTFETAPQPISAGDGRIQGLGREGEGFAASSN